MSAATASLPPLGKISLIGIWIETVLWGMNCVIFASTVWILLGKNNGSRWMLLITSTLLFSFATAHVALSLKQLLDAFINVPESMESPLYATLYWANEANGIAVAKTVLYDTSVWLQDIVLFVVDLAHMGAAYAATGLLALPNANIYGNTLGHLGPVGWSLDLVVNITVTAAIAGRLYYMGRRVSGLAGSEGLEDNGNPYTATIFTIVESGAVFAAVTLVMLVLYVTGSAVALTGIDISTQLAVLTPLLIIVRVGLGLTHGLPRAYKSFLSTNGDMTFADRWRSTRGTTSTIGVEDPLSSRHDTAFDVNSQSHIKFAPGASS